MLFRPYKRVLFIQGVIPAHIKDFIARITSGAIDYESDVFESKVYKDMFIGTFNAYIKEHLNLFQRLTLGACLGISGKILYKHMNGLIKELSDTASFILYIELGGLDMREVEKAVRSILHKEFFMLEIYGAILGGILGVATALVLQVIP